MKLRHGLVHAASPLLLAGLLAGCGGGDAASADGTTDSLVVVNPGGDWGDCQTEKFFEPFTAETGVEVIAGANQTVGQIEAGVRAQEFGADVTYPGQVLPFREDAADFLEPIDYSKIDKDKLVPGTYNDYAVSIDVFSWVIGHRTDEFDGAVPAGWADFFDTEAFPGKRALPVDLDNFGVIYAALMADGVSPDQLLPLDLDRAFAKLDTIKDDIVWYTSGSQGQELLRSGEVTMGMEFANRVTDMENAAIQWNQQIIAGDFVGVPKGNPNVETAMDLIAFTTSTEVNGTFTECAAGAPSNVESEVDPAVAETLPTSHLDVEYLSENETALAEYVAANFDEITDRFNEWRGQ
jgi:putative spermidine/putrescine transport system substrate-binding protein